MDPIIDLSSVWSFMYGIRRKVIHCKENCKGKEKKVAIQKIPRGMSYEVWYRESEKGRSGTVDNTEKKKESYIGLYIVFNSRPTMVTCFPWRFPLPVHSVTFLNNPISNVP